MTDPLLSDLAAATHAGRVAWELSPDRCGNTADPEHVLGPVDDDRLWISAVVVQAEAFGWRFMLRRSRGLSADYTTGDPITNRTERHSLTCYSLDAEAGRSRDGRICCLDFPSPDVDGASDEDVAALFRAVAPLSKVWEPPVLPSHEDLVAALRRDLAEAALADKG